MKNGSETFKCGSNNILLVQKNNIQNFGRNFNQNESCSEIELSGVLDIFEMEKLPLESF